MSLLCNDSTIYVRYGETVEFAVTFDNLSATGGVFYVAETSMTPVISKAFTLTAGAGVIELDELDTSIPLGEYNYSIVIDGAELPSAESTQGQLPKFIVSESVKNVEVI